MECPQARLFRPSKETTRKAALLVVFLPEQKGVCDTPPHVTIASPRAFLLFGRSSDLDGGEEWRRLGSRELQRAVAQMHEAGLGGVRPGGLWFGSVGFG